eukprot:12618146-Ditylum_brightwellii.AAC.1
MDLWACNKSLSSLKGKEILGFIKNIDEVVVFLKENFVVKEKLDALCKALVMWRDMSLFINRTEVNNYVTYEQEDIYDFEHKLELFYACGSKTFLTKKEVGDGKTFYYHVLKGYMPKLVRTSWEEYEVGIGVYNIQEYERRNKESKNASKKFTNNKGNVAIQGMKRLYDEFHYS